MQVENFAGRKMEGGHILVGATHPAAFTDASDVTLTGSSIGGFWTPPPHNQIQRWRSSVLDSLPGWKNPGPLQQLPVDMNPYFKDVKQRLGMGASGMRLQVIGVR